VAIKKKKKKKKRVLLIQILHRGSHYYGISIDNKVDFYLWYTHSWINAKMKEFLFIQDAKNSRIIFYQSKRITKFNDSFFRIKVYTPNFNHKKFKKVFEKSNIRS